MTGKPRFVGRRLRAFYRSTLLHDAVQEGNLSCVKWLLEIGADPRMKNHEGESPLMIAQRLGYVGISKLLASSAAKLDDVLQSDGNTTTCLPVKNLVSRSRYAYARLFGKGQVYNASASKPEMA
jgi:ankyrin repeat protein